MSAKICLAVDLGAGSGRVLAGIYDGTTLTLRELNRFPSEGVKDESGWHWEFDRLLRHIKDGIAIAVKEYGAQVASLGVDTWGVDYGLLGADGELLGQPFQYRDSRTDGMMERACALMPKAEIYRRTGIQFMFFNTLFQLLAEKKLADADRLLFMPCLINYMLTGQKINERSIASTGQLLAADTQRWDGELLAAMGFSEKIFGELADAGANLGSLSAAVQREVGATNLQVIAPGCHDTASAVAGTPADDDGMVFLSSGTWSLMGRELKAPVLTPESFTAGFSNETGVCGTTRYLKNIAGMWLLQECKRVWDADSQPLGYDAIIRAAADADAFVSLIDPDAADFQAPENMPAAIVNFCKKTSQPAPLTVGQFARCIFESLALKYRATLAKLEQLTGSPAAALHIVGGGSQNALLNQFAADATNRPVIAGPVEATSIGNILLQLMSLGDLPSLSAGRALVRRSFATAEYQPQNPAAWDGAAERFKNLCHSNR
ncbi:MAG: rhamnulokinase [Verrucomicrobiales bacterium]|jgi:sugar (pentulose or hexulose) kinase|nr:rhamnulokinase [Verrucomicrobiales bacterium]